MGEWLGFVTLVKGGGDETVGNSGSSKLWTTFRNETRSIEIRIELFIVFVKPSFIFGLQSVGLNPVST